MYFQALRVEVLACSYKRFNLLFPGRFREDK